MKSLFFEQGATAWSAKKLEAGSFWLVTDSQLQQLSVKYDKEGFYFGLIFELLQLSNI
ncbi:hypothetical protein [Mastigocoleus sp. MO_188.B34]|uniref:hypothetical protein n=1 Tax=Mastigocoleus sp. MO_188.B34 TaxID=3036635 RepID=UPI00260DBD71|nr:hypothetical protein [Mastigocoleus sp. MO_188.B34]MDJ0697630.1 hypothetical protein [Mastigocoleus sp. MO_188.B34]